MLCHFEVHLPFTMQKRVCICGVQPSRLYYGCVYRSLRWVLYLLRWTTYLAGGHCTGSHDARCHVLFLTAFSIQALGHSPHPSLIHLEHANETVPITCTVVSLHCMLHFLLFSKGSRARMQPILSASLLEHSCQYSNFLLFSSRPRHWC